MRSFGSVPSMERSGFTSDDNLLCRLFLSVLYTVLLNSLRPEPILRGVVVVFFAKGERSTLCLVQCVTLFSLLLKISISGLVSFYGECIVSILLIMAS